MLLILAILFAALALSGRWLRPLASHAFILWVVATGCLAAARPALFIHWGGFELKTAIAPLVSVILLGMGMTLTFDDFRRVLRMPQAIGVGILLQFSVLPCCAWLFAGVFGLHGAAAAGVILIGSVSGGTASNVVTYLAKGNVPLSITMTACSTLAAPFLTPVAMKLLAGAHVAVDVWDMMRSILLMVVAPLLAGLFIHRWMSGLAERLERVLPAVAMAGICAIVGITIALSRDELLRTGLAVVGACVCLNITGLGGGWLGAKLFRMNDTDARTMAIEIGMQHGGMATGIAFNVLHEPLAALGSAVFGPFSAISTSFLASRWRKKADLGENRAQRAADGDGQK
ncbi:MAG: bile acid:sodium symporter family protein [Opitutaceae bacterium]|jgi:BASS family bile acid:Na+ symporter|nr:bile acid:sodium symporter family protein [Opitutaceae bacterium]